jgi:sulfate adenylyltransferase subunit 2
MDKAQSERARLYAKLPVYRRRLAQAMAIIEEGLERCDSPYVACSFGKDSAVVLHMVRQLVPDVQARFISWPETELLGDYERVMGEWRALGADIRVLNLSRKTLDEKVADRWLQLQAVEPADGYFSGMRKEESRARRVILNSQGAIAYIKQSGTVRICPIADWKTEDVAAYVVEHDLPTLKAYKDHGFETRTASRVPRAAFSIREQALEQLRQDDPAAYRQLEQMYPEVAQWR